MKISKVSPKKMLDNCCVFLISVLVLLGAAHMLPIWGENTEAEKQAAQKLLPGSEISPQEAALRSDLIVLGKVGKPDFIFLSGWTHMHGAKLTDTKVLMGKPKSEMTVDYRKDQIKETIPREDQELILFIDIKAKKDPVLIKMLEPTPDNLKLVNEMIEALQEKGNEKPSGPRKK